MVALFYVYSVEVVQLYSKNYRFKNISILFKLLLRNL